ncbi:MAG: hypothetical protein ACFB15_21130 [Cyclobacteriaceae bacterium]
MKRLPNFSIIARSPISSWFREQGIQDFYSVIRHLKTMPLPQSGMFGCFLPAIKEGKSNSAHNALLSVLARENQRSEIKLALCTYTESYSDSPLVRCVLQEHNLPAIPEVDCYLKYQDDFYSPVNSGLGKTQPIISEIEINHQQVGSFMKRYHRHFVNHWLQLEKLHHTWTFEGIKRVKEECLKVLEKESWHTNRPPFQA